MRLVAGSLFFADSYGRLFVQEAMASVGVGWCVLGFVFRVLDHCGVVRCRNVALRDLTCGAMDLLGFGVRFIDQWRTTRVSAGCSLAP